MPAGRSFIVSPDPSGPARRYLRLRPGPNGPAGAGAFARRPMPDDDPGAYRWITASDAVLLMEVRVPVEQLPLAALAPVDVGHPQLYRRRVVGPASRTVERSTPKSTGVVIGSAWFDLQWRITRLRPNKREGENVPPPAPFLSIRG